VQHPPLKSDTTYKASTPHHTTTAHHSTYTSSTPPHSTTATPTRQAHHSAATTLQRANRSAGKRCTGYAICARAPPFDMAIWGSVEEWGVVVSRFAHGMTFAPSVVGW
jgi:hypothetical protein